MISPSSPRQTFAQNAADFTKKYGMKIAAATLLISNVGLIAQPFWNPESYTYLRNTSAAWFQYAANAYQLKGRREEAYDYAVFGGASHTAASFSQGLFYGGVMWALFTEASYRASHWPQKVGAFTQKYFGDVKTPKLVDAIGETFKKAKEKTFPKKNIVNELIDNKLDLLKDPHARAGCVALVSNVGQAIEAGLSHHTTLSPFVLGAWIIASAFYAGHGLLHARDKKRAQNALAPVTT